MSIYLNDLTSDQEKVLLDLYTQGYSMARVRQISGINVPLHTIMTLAQKHKKLRYRDPREGTAVDRSGQSGRGWINSA